MPYCGPILQHKKWTWVKYSSNFTTRLRHSIILAKRLAPAVMPGLIWMRGGRGKGREARTSGAASLMTTPGLTAVAAAAAGGVAQPGYRQRYAH